MSILIFSLFIGQFSGECLETIKKVGIKTHPTKMYLIVKYKASIFDYLCEKYRQAPITDKDWERLTHYLEAKYPELLKNKP